MAEPQPSKLVMRVRFPSSAPARQPLATRYAAYVVDGAAEAPVVNSSDSRWSASACGRAAAELRGVPTPSG